MNKYIIYPPSAYGSKGDEAMIRGGINLLSPGEFILVNPNKHSWLTSLIWEYEDIVELAPDENVFLELSMNGYELILICGDVLDGTCGTDPSFERLSVIELFARSGREVKVFLSYRSNVQEEIKDRISKIVSEQGKNISFYLRDNDSLHRFKQDIDGTHCCFFPDLSFFSFEPINDVNWLDRNFPGFLQRENSRVAINISEHSFRATCSDFTDEKRIEYISSLLQVIVNFFPDSDYFCISNDIRFWSNFWSDYDYAVACSRLLNDLPIKGRVFLVNPIFDYGDNISTLRLCDFLFTGRMHLAVASFRASCIPIPITGSGKGLSVVDNNVGMLDKASGILRWIFGDQKLVASDIDELPVIIEGLVENTQAIRKYLEERLFTISDEIDLLVKNCGFNENAKFAPRYNRDAYKLKASLDQVRKEVFERELSQRENFKLAIAERDEQIEGLNQAMAERDGQIEGLNQAMAERGGQIAGINQRVAYMESSRSWRMTAPYRWLGRLVKRPLAALASKRLLSRLVISTLLLPAACQYFGGFVAVMRRFSSGPGAFAEVIADQAVLRERLSSHSPFLRHFVFATFSLAIRIQRAGSAKRSIGNFLRIVRSEGMGGIRRRIITTAPSITDLRERRRVELPILADEVARRILVADYRVPRPNVSAGDQATVGILQDLCALGYEVVFLPNDMVSSPHYEDALKATGVQVVSSRSGFSSSSGYLEVHGSKFGAFYLIRVDVAETLLPVARRVAPDARVIFHAPDLHFLRQIREAELRGDQLAREGALNTRDREVAMMSRSDRVVLVSPSEVTVLSEVLPDTPISVFPALYVPVVDSPHPFAKRDNIFFLGGFAHQPNVSAVQWFAAEVWPHVHKVLPDVEFHIIGAEAPPSVLALGQLPGVKVLGFVPKLNRVLETLRVGVAPLQYGSGIKGKVAVAMGAGIPCVCTDIAAEGMCIKNNVHALIENEPFHFAQAIETLYKDEMLWSRLARNGQLLVREKYGDFANRASLLKVLDQSQALPIFLFNEYCKGANLLPLPNFVTETDIDVSVIISGDKDYALTRACLASVVQTSVGSGLSYELILAVDDDTDEENFALKMFQGLRIINKPKNQTFSCFCNNVIDQLHGRYFVLLNGNEIVLPGWLENLYKLLESDPSIAIAGSKLLNFEGEIIEAGAFLLSSGDGISFGQKVFSENENRLARRHEPIFNIRRETDFFSRAPMLLRRSFLKCVGFLDEEFDLKKFACADLAIRARALGMRLIYEPQSEVICSYSQQHLLEISALISETHQKESARFIEKWQHVLKCDYLHPGSLWHQIAARAERSVPMSVIERRKKGKLNILYFSPFPSHPSNHGNQATIQQFAKRFQTMGHKVHFALLQSSIYSDEDIGAMKNTWDSFDILSNSKPLWSDGNPIDFDEWYQDGLGEKIRLLCEKYEIDVVFCSYVFQSKILEFVPDYILKVIDTHDKMGDRYEMLRKNGQPLEFFSCSSDDEGAYLRRADVVLARRAEEASYFDSVTGRQSAIVVPHFEDPQFIIRNFNKLEKIGIVASANQINLAIVSHFLEVLNSKFDTEIHNFTVHIAGQVKDMVLALPSSEQHAFNRPWVVMHGFVSEISEFYKEMDLIISPVTMGTGINVKTVQAMAYGMPLLTTKCGGKGIETEEAYHQFDDLCDLVNRIFELAENPAELNRLATISRCRYEFFFQEGEQMLRKIIARVTEKDRHQEKTSKPCVFKFCEENNLSQSKKNVSKYYKNEEVVANVCLDCAYVSFPAPSDSDLQDYYSNIYGEASAGWYSLEEDYDHRKVSSRANDVQRLIDTYIDKDANAITLEIGCAFGGTVNELRKRGISAFGCDLNSDAIKKGRNFGNFYIEADYAHRVMAKASKKANVVYSYHTLEHIPDLGDFLQSLKNCLAERSILEFRVPNGAYLKSWKSGFENWDWFAYPDHLHMLTPKSVFCLANALGYEVVDITSRACGESVDSVRSWLGSDFSEFPKKIREIVSKAFSSGSDEQLIAILERYCLLQELKFVLCLSGSETSLKHGGINNSVCHTLSEVFEVEISLKDFKN